MKIISKYTANQDNTVSKTTLHPKRHRWYWWLVCIPLAAVMFLAARTVDGFAEWYALHFYPLLAQPLHFVSGLLPISLMELVLIALALAALMIPVLFIIRLCRTQRGGRLRRFGKGMLRLLCVVGAVALVFVLLAGINYQRNSFTSYSGLTLQKSNTAELQALCESLAARANALSVQQLRGADGVAQMLPEGYRAMANKVDAAYQVAAGRLPVLGGRYQGAKPMWLLSWLMSRMQLTGVFFPFTVEANVNINAPSYNLPYTTAHELAHLRGFMREDEANYIAYYVCCCSDDVMLQYSGILLALIHAGNQLSRVDPGAYNALVQSYTPELLADLRQNNAFWAQYDDKPLSEAGDAMNDAYLKANGQQDGVQSYGRMVDLLLAEWRACQEK